MKTRSTERGFGIIEFFDCYNEECCIQESSSAVEPKIWFGAKKLRVQEFTAGSGWKDVDLKDTPEHPLIGNQRMHLNQKQVEKLLPILQHFAETGQLPDNFSKT